MKTSMPNVGSLFRTVAATLAFAGAAANAGEPVFTTGADGTIRVQAATYSAVIAPGGALVSLEVAGTEFLGDKPARGAPFPGKAPAETVTIRGHGVVARNDAVHIVYTFDDRGFTVETEGASFQASISPAVSALILADGAVLPARQSTGDVRKIVAGETALTFDQPFHHTYGSLWPSRLARGGKPEEPFRFRVECGVPLAAGELVELGKPAAAGKLPDRIPFFAAGEAQRFGTTVRNLGVREETVTLRWNVTDRYGGGPALDGDLLPPLTVASGKEAHFSFDARTTTPGCRWLEVALLHGDTTLRRREWAFVTAADDYRPPLTRPADFAAFWSARLAEWRAVPLDVRAAEVAERSTQTAVHWRVTLTVAPECRVTLDLQAPRAPGKRLATMGGKLGEKAERADAVVASLGHEGWPESATYTRWVSADDNNMLDCIRTMVRICDYLRQRPDVDHIFLHGASRQGPLVLIAAALDPDRIRAVDAHVPTSLGISWTDPPYRGWGRVPSPPAMAAYVDPVNFAPDLTVPFLLDLGMFDGLSPAPGGLALYNHATRAPWKRISLEPGGHGYFTSGFRKAARAELEAFVRGVTVPGAN